MTLRAFPIGAARLLPSSGRIEHHELPSLFFRRFRLVRDYLVSLREESLLRPYVQETGAFAWGAGSPAPRHGGWEAPDCQLRGHFLGHWLSATARIAAAMEDEELALRARGAVAGLASCQRENGGEWAFSIPEKYLHRIAAGKPVWAPHYTVHKTLMGLVDAFRFTGDERALEVAAAASQWFHRWTGGFTREQLDDILDFETGGMLEVWADLYGITGERRYAELIERYDRPRLFDALLAGEDPLTNRHANTTIPEALGAARAFEVTGDERWRRIVEAYWRCAVTDRGCFATGGQTSFEVWTPPHELAARLGERTQEHCTVYNLVRLAAVLLRWTGDASYADYIERNLYNGILAAQHPSTGMVTYYLPLRAGGRKAWGTPTESFWCCHGTLVQAHSQHEAHAWFEHRDGVTVAQYIPSRLRLAWDGVPVELTLTMGPEIGTHVAAGPDRGADRRPDRWMAVIEVRAAEPVEFELRVRIPGWVRSEATVRIDGEAAAAGPGFHAVRRVWRSDVVRVELPKAVWTEALPDRPDTVAFLDGPVVLAGLCDEERELTGDPSSILIPDDERDPYEWNGGYRASGQQQGLRFVPLHEVVDDRYTVYFPLRDAPGTLGGGGR